LKRSIGDVVDLVFAVSGLICILAFISFCSIFALKGGDDGDLP